MSGPITPDLCARMLLKLARAEVVGGDCPVEIVETTTLSVAMQVLLVAASDNPAIESPMDTCMDAAMVVFGRVAHQQGWNVDEVAALLAEKLMDSMVSAAAVELNGAMQEGGRA